MKIGIIVPCFNRALFTKICLSNIVRSLVGDRDERPLVILNDGSTDETGVVVSEVGYKGKVVVTHEVNRGLPATYNHGFEVARELGCEAAVIVDNDLLVPVFFDRVLKRGLENHPKAAIAGLVVNDKNVIKWLGKTRDDGTLNYDYLFEQQICESTAIGGGASVAVRIKMWEDAGGFNEDRGSYAYTDSRFFNVARRRGWTTLVDSRIQCFELQQFAYTDHSHELQKLRKRFMARNGDPASKEFDGFIARALAGRVHLTSPSLVD